MTPNTHCNTCDAPLYRSPSKIRGINNYCDQNCRNHRSIVWIGYVYANYKTMTVAQISAHIGIPPDTLRTWVYNYNKWGIRIAFKPGPVPKDGIGCRAVARRKREAARLERQKAKPTPVKKERPVKTPKVKKVKCNTSPCNHGKPPKKDPTQYKTRTVEFNPEIHAMVKTGPRTWKQVNKVNQKMTA